MLHPELIHPLGVFALGLVAACVLLGVALVGPWTGGGRVRSLLLLPLLPLVVALMLMVWDGVTPLGESVYHLCTTDVQRASHPFFVRFMPDVGRLGYALGWLLIWLAVMHWLYGHVLDGAEESERQLRRQFIVRSRRLLLFGGALSFVAFMNAAMAGFPPYVAVVDAGVVLAALPVLGWVGVSALPRLRCAGLNADLWRPAQWSAWGPLLLVCGALVMAVGISLLHLGDAPYCFRTLDFLDTQ